VRDRADVVVLLERDRPRQRKRLHMVGIELQRLRDEPLRLALQALALRHRQRVGVIRVEVGIVGHRTSVEKVPLMKFLISLLK